MKIKAHLVKPEPGRSRRNGIVTEELARALRRAIFQGEFHPGDPLPELHLAKRFGVSQAVVRESLSALAHAGLVRRFPNKGTFVTSLTPAEIGEHIRLRLVLETIAWIDAAARCQPADFEGLRRQVAAMGAATANADYDAAAQADLDFHRQIWRLSGDATLARMLDQITLPLFAFVSVYRSQRHDDLSRLAPEHEAIIQALLRRDAREIQELVRCQAAHSYGSFVQVSFDPAMVLGTVESKLMATE